MCDSASRANPEKRRRLGSFAKSASGAPPDKLPTTVRIKRLSVRDLREALVSIGQGTKASMCREKQELVDLLLRSCRSESVISEKVRELKRRAVIMKIDCSAIIDKQDLARTLAQQAAAIVDRKVQVAPL